MVTVTTTSASTSTTTAAAAAAAAAAAIVDENERETSRSLAYPRQFLVRCNETASNSSPKNRGPLSSSSIFRLSTIP